MSLKQDFILGFQSLGFSDNLSECSIVKVKVLVT